MLEFANGRVEHADLVVGADGVRSTVRRWVTGADDAIYSGTSAFRGIVPTENLPSLPDPHAIQFWMGPDAHLLHYAIGGNGESVNFFAVVETPRIWLHDGSVRDVGDDVPVGSFRGWHPAVTEMIRAAASPIRWGLFAVRPLLRWYRGRVVVLGDAAHGMLPHHGQGANTSIEDAFALGRAARRRQLRTTSSRRCRASRHAPRSDAEDPAELVGDQRPAPPARRPRSRSARREGGHGAARLRWIHAYDVQEALEPPARPPRAPGRRRSPPTQRRPLGVHSKANSAGGIHAAGRACCPVSARSSLSSPVDRSDVTPEARFAAISASTR